MLLSRLKYYAYTSVNWIIVVVLGASRCLGVGSECQTPSQQLLLKYNRGNIHPQNYPTHLVKGQYCEWTFPHHRYPGEGLLIYVDEVDLMTNRNGGRTIVGDIKIGEGDMFTTMPRANCRFFGKDISDVDMNKLSTYVKKMNEKFGRFCVAWFFDMRMPQSVVFRVYRDKTEADLRGKKFQLKFDYVNVSKAASGASGASPPIAMTTASSFANEVTNGQSRESESQACTGKSSDFLVLAVLCVVLIGSNVLIGFFLWRKHQSMGRQPCSPHQESQPTFHQGHINEGSYASILEQTAPYSSVPVQRLSEHPNSDTVPYASVSEQPPSNQALYDVPTNNRLRTPTVHSSHSIVTDMDYQNPRSLTKVEEGPAQQSQSREGKDVYAAVDKTKKKNSQK